MRVEGIASEPHFREFCSTDDFHREGKEEQGTKSKEGYVVLTPRACLVFFSGWHPAMNLTSWSQFLCSLDKQTLGKLNLTAIYMLCVS
jgi:hypothetical protein